ncbi:polysaccharide deacetylase family protein [Texcoconibacillus texcoconensis]|uniref:Peptidoglycan/xylan/chitin deacetylase (PgdA/CDA1 family) n=1 Tax=Texcoconibacillus texcoconensis TaxID=1095777 RepID=A0A840QN92_9BACI|nr:polysaccharide deacetylase family protein [Texcoconibacillus texcoconensis]MBB5172839.1 peptidoglycan/xylan/chitin deacetylase (PgdA/CDA1 family) [Texcoconibacillus texcoconensis]
MLRYLMASFLFLLLLQSCSSNEKRLASSIYEIRDNDRSFLKEIHETDRLQTAPADYEPVKDELIKKWTYASPNESGEEVTGVAHALDTDDKVIALTFDACGNESGDGYDEELIEFLIEEEIPATLFINARWIDEHHDTFHDLANHELFAIENHGTEHLPLFVQQATVWGIEGTNHVSDVIDEVMINQQKIERLTGEPPQYFRSGTAHYDDIAVQVVNDLGLNVVNFDILGDAGATYSKTEVEHSLLQAEPGSIALLHMNKPESETAEGVKRAIPQLQENGYNFVHLDDYPLLTY